MMVMCSRVRDGWGDVSLPLLSFFFLSHLLGVGVDMHLCV